RLKTVLQVKPENLSVESRVRVTEALIDCARKAEIHLLDDGQRLHLSVLYHRREVGPSQPRDRRDELRRRVGAKCLGQYLAQRYRQLSEVDVAAEKYCAEGVYGVAAEIGAEFEIVPAARHAEVVEELNAPLRSIRWRREFPAEDADAGHINAGPERVYGVDIVGVADRLEAEFIRRSAAETMRLAENEGAVSISYVEARRWREEAPDADVVLTVVGQTVSEEEKILFVQAVVEPKAARARRLNYGEHPGRTGEQVEGVAVGAVLRSGERRQKSLTLPNEERVARSDQRGDQILLPRGRLQDRGVGQDRREIRFPPDQAFVCREEEGPVFLDWPAEGEAGLVALEGRVLLLRLGEGVARVEPLV